MRYCGTSALALALLAGCSENDDVWSGASGWIIGVLIGILLLAGIMAARRKRR